MNQMDGLPIFKLGQKFNDSPSKKTAWKIIRKYFDFYQSDGTEEAIWQLVEEAMSSDNELIKGVDRSNIIFFYQYVKLLNKAIFFLYERKTLNKNVHS